MNRQYQTKASIMLIVYGLLSISIVTAFLLICRYVLHSHFGLEVFAIPFSLMLLFSSVPMIIGITQLIGAKRYKKYVMSGRKAECEVYELTIIKGCYLLSVSYVGESGATGYYAVTIPYKEVIKLKKGMKIACYIKGDACYIDPKNIEIIPDLFF